MTHTRRTSHNSPGVTLVEMMVALAITTFVILVVNQLFNEVITTVGRGTQAGEILQRSRAFDEQLATETELIISGGRDPSNNPYDWFGRMVGPVGRNPGEPGGFLVVVQRVVNAPLTIDDQLKGITRSIRSDQLMFIYDQRPSFDQTGKKRLPPLAPANAETFGGDMRDSLYADYVRMWYGHVLQLRDNQDPTQLDLRNKNNYADIDLGNLNAGNPNAIAQDWVLGRQALFLTDSAPINVPLGDPLPVPYGPYVPLGFLASAQSNVIAGGLTGPVTLGNGIADVAQVTLNQLINGNTIPPLMGLDASPNILSYQGAVLRMMFAASPLLTTAKQVGSTGRMRAWDVAPTHTYFMGGVSDFIVEWAGDLVTGRDFSTPVPDGELDRDLDGRIKWYTAINPNPVLIAGNDPVTDINAPVTYAPPPQRVYKPTVPPTFLGAAGLFPRADAAFVWQHAGSPGFTRWPWLIRIRYRLHDRRGEFEGRQVIVNTATGETQPEAGAWFETIIPVNYQGVK